ncbi:rod shape-determining protein MreC [Acidicapsa acidisoli]|uniref:rod shape-determining protein MreC n=1 Tax=Acidicapsa acidisoli TaxID=1615681 RepID=UPI0021DFE3E9|nr:rod shape-determining protein MreC [Acidicapsa acidisoli]
MESFFSRYRNLIVLLAALLLQMMGLAVQVRRPVPVAANVPGGPAVHSAKDGRGVLVIRLWAAGMVTPFERLMHGSSEGLGGLWNEYVDLRHTRDENRQLLQTIDRLRLEQAELHEDALQGQRLQELVKFRESYAYATVAAQVIGTSGSMQSHVIYLDKGSADGLAPDMAVITGDGIVGKVRDVFPHSAQVLVINDQTSGAGVVLEKTRIRGILRGNAMGQPQVINILADSRIQPGERVLTAGGDQIFPRGLPVGVVEKVVRDAERGAFINVIVTPAANLQHLDEVLVITSLDAHLSAQQKADLATSEDLKGAVVAAEAAAEAERKKAAAEMEERLPGLQDPNAPAAAAPKVGPDGKPVAPTPTVPATAKPLPAAHPDRFTPGAAGSDTNQDTNSGASGEDNGTSGSKPKQASKTPQNSGRTQ